MSNTSSQYTWWFLSLFAFGIAIRAATSLHPYSGEHTPPVYGDYEAQRHWMEITLNLPPSDWYRNTSQNNLSYWGLDYPPLSAYVSYVFGKLLHFVDSNAVALHSSHGYQTPTTRAVMRTTVLIVDAFLFFPALFLLSALLHCRRTAHVPLQNINLVFSAVAFCITLPALIMVDHAHFQYNNFSLALVVLSLTAFLSRKESLGAIFFCTAVYFKHMSLYYATAIFAYLLAQTISRLRRNGLLSAMFFTASILLAIFSTTIVVFSPWLAEKHLIHALLRRLFPFTRGLYEDKVANFWCSISIFIKLNVLLPQDKLVILCAGVTVLASIPFCVAVFLRPSPIRLMLSTCGCSLAAFLFSYQVHEKQIIIPLLPLAFLYPLYPALSIWMSLTTVFSLFPLLLREQSLTAYVATMVLHVSVVYMKDKRFVNGGRWRSHNRLRIPGFLSALIGCAINLALIFGTPPTGAPDVFVLINTMYASAHLCLIYVTVLYLVFVS